MKAGLSYSLDNLPPEISKEIISYLSPEDWAHLKCVSRYFDSLLSTPLFQNDWDPLLTRLQALAPFSLTDFQGEMEKPFKEALFKVTFNFINILQKREIDHFMQYSSEDHSTPIAKIVSEYIAEKVYSAVGTIDIKGINQPASTLAQLEEKHYLLDKINAAFICNQLNIESGILQINATYITRIPFNAFPEESWKHVKAINCGYNDLQYLPDFLERCPQLDTLYCEHSNLLFLHESLSKCTKLKKLDCSHNQLQSLPDALIEKLGMQWAYHTLYHQNFLPYRITHNLLHLGLNQSKRIFLNMLPSFNLFKCENPKEKRAENAANEEEKKSSYDL